MNFQDIFPWAMDLHWEVHKDKKEAWMHKQKYLFFLILMSTAKIFPFLFSYFS